MDAKTRARLIVEEALNRMYVTLTGDIRFAWYTPCGSPQMLHVPERALSAGVQEAIKGMLAMVAEDAYMRGLRDATLGEPCAWSIPTGEVSEYRPVTGIDEAISDWRAKRRVS